MRRNLSSLTTAVLRIAIMSVFMWSCSNGGGNRDSGGSKAKVAVVGDNTNTEMSEFLEGQGLEVDNYDLFQGSVGPVMSSTVVVWEDRRNRVSGNNSDIYAHVIASGREFRVNQDSGYANQSDPDTDGDYIVWRDDRNGNDRDLYAYQISTDVEFKVNQDIGSARQFSPKISGDVIVWGDERNGDFDIYAYRISTDTEFKVSQDPGTASQNFPEIDGDWVIWVDRRNADGGDIYARNVSTLAPEFRVNQDASTTSQVGSVHLGQHHRLGGQQER